MMNFAFFRDCKKAVELNKSLRLRGLISVHDETVLLQHRVFLEMFKTYTKAAHDSPYPVRYSTVIGGIEFTCLLTEKEDKEVV